MNRAEELNAELMEARRERNTERARADANEKFATRIRAERVKLEAENAGLREQLAKEKEWLGNQRRTARAYREGAEKRGAKLEAAGMREAEYAYECAEDRLDDLLREGGDA